MKKIFLALIILLISPALLFAAGSCTQTDISAYTGGFTVIKLACTGDSSNGSIPNIALSAENMAIIQGTHYLYSVEAYPTSGGTAPDAADVFILNESGLDLLGSVDGDVTPNKGKNLINATLAKSTFPYNSVTATYWYPTITGVLTLKVINQLTASANWTIELVFTR